MSNNLVNVAFVCVHNSCRSQIAEALGKIILKGKANVYSAGTDISRGINKDAVRILKQLYSIDMTINQKSKLVEELPAINHLITMGCNVNCPNIKSDFKDDWGLEDPSNKSDEEFIKVINTIIEKLFILRNIL
ncbi:MAG: arsenate reductase ArsC [Anaeroplasmataceae bacterium]